MSEVKQSDVCFIGNIPNFYHAKHLRMFFSTYIENCSFEVFHFRHRPETDDEKKKSGLLCVFVKVHHRFCDNFVRLYHGKHWLDKSGDESISLRCKIIKLSSIKGSTLEEHKKYLKRSEVEKLKKRVGFAKVSVSNFIQTAESNLLEFNPPPDMPQGNVGTPTAFFVKLINECRLSVKVIKKLGLRFPKIRRRGKYSAVSYEYGNVDNSCQLEEEFDYDHYLEDFDHYEVVAGNGKSILNEEDYVNYKHSEREMKDEIEDHDRECKTGSTEISEKSNRDEDMDDDETEEWDRFEALHDDPHNINRGKCKRYEEELEIVWEKGGSGLVFYTDEQVWREKSQLEIFDEPTNYDWDMDTSVWYERGGGDKDAKDLAAMRLESRWEVGIDDGVGAENFFNVHENSVARKLMEKFGWRPGECLGCASRNGLKTALCNEGQKPRDKTGLGYYGPKLVRRVVSDQPTTDEIQRTCESLYRRCDPNDIIKYRSFKNFVCGQTLNP